MPKMAAQTMGKLDARFVDLDIIDFPVGLVESMWIQRNEVVARLPPLCSVSK